MNLLPPFDSTNPSWDAIPKRVLGANKAPIDWDSQDSFGPVDPDNPDPYRYNFGSCNCPDNPCWAKFGKLPYPELDTVRLTISGISTPTGCLAVGGSNPPGNVSDITLTDLNTVLTGVEFGVAKRFGSWSGTGWSAAGGCWDYTYPYGYWVSGRFEIKVKCEDPVCVYGLPAEATTIYAIVEDTELGYPYGTPKILLFDSRGGPGLPGTLCEPTDSRPWSTWVTRYNSLAFDGTITIERETDEILDGLCLPSDP